MGNDALETYKKSWFSEICSLIMFWSPLLYVNFKYLPINYRGTFVGVGGYFWAIILSYRVGGTEKKILTVETPEDVKLYNCNKDILSKPNMTNIPEVKM